MLNPTHVRIARTYVSKVGLPKQRIRRSGRETNVKEGNRRVEDLILQRPFDLGKKAAGSRLGKMLINNAIDYIPTAL